MATDITTDIDITTPSTAQNRPCWECSLPVAPYQAVRTMNAWQAVICEGCESWVATHLGPLANATIH